MPRLVIRLLGSIIRSRPSPEIIVVALCVMLLLAVAVPAMLHIREQARRHTTQNQLQQVGVALQSYHETFLSYPFSSSLKFNETNLEANEPASLVSPLMVLVPHGS